MCVTLTHGAEEDREACTLPKQGGCMAHESQKRSLAPKHAAPPSTRCRQSSRQSMADAAVASDDTIGLLLTDDPNHHSSKWPLLDHRSDPAACERTTPHVQNPWIQDDSCTQSLDRSSRSDGQPSRSDAPCWTLTASAQTGTPMTRSPSHRKGSRAEHRVDAFSSFSASLVRTSPPDGSTRRRLHGHAHMARGSTAQAA